MLIKTPSGLVVIDFKTDRVADEKVAERGLLYRNQLDFYCLAAEAILQSKVNSKWIYFLEPGRPYQLK